MNSATTVPAEAVRDLFLSQIPTETTPAERRLLFRHFSQQWPGDGTVVEIGPFLGGTTRAIAWGMQNNARLTPGSMLHTYDRFDMYYSAAQLRSTIEPMVRGGIFTKEQADELCRDANFERLFNAIHSPHAYASLVKLHNSPLPDRPEEIDGSASLDSLAGVGEFTALFIDGCKSWASTHYAMKTLLPRLRVGQPVIFQDFGWYTCFWITAFTHALRDYFEPGERADATYLFRLKKAVAAAEVEQRFARTPAEMSATFFRKSAAALLERSRATGDLQGELIAQLHHVAALATIGRRGAAVDILRQLEVRRYAPFAYMIRGCLKSPTYLPGGKPVLWKEAA
jgi:hypothetical protein